MRRVLTVEMYNALLEAYRSSPGNAAFASRHAGLDRRCAQRAWNTGWKEYAWAPAIKQVIAEEAEQQRVELLKQQAANRKAIADEQDKTRLEITDRKRQMLQLSKALRGTLGAGVAAVQRISSVLAKAMETFPADLDAIQALQPYTKIRMVREATRASSDLSVAFERLDRMARLDDEKPTQIVGLAPIEMTPKEAADEIREAYDMVQLMEAEGLIEAEQVQQLGDGTDNGKGSNGNGSNGSAVH